MGKKHNLASCWAMQYSLLAKGFSTYLQKWEGCFSENLLKIWKSLVALQLPSDCWVVFWTNEYEKQITTTFCSKVSKNVSTDFAAKLIVFKKDDNKDFELLQTLTMGAVCLNQFLWLSNQLVIAAENFGREENLSPVVISTMSKDIDEHFKLSQKVVYVVDRWNRKINVTVLR